MKDAAKEPLQKGLAAAQQQDWKLAIRYFLEAQKADPQAPQIWFNLGLASSKLPGYELRALAWLQAYLLAVPDAPNRDAIREQVAALEVSFELRLGKIIDGLEPFFATRWAAAVERAQNRNLSFNKQYIDAMTNWDLSSLAAARAYLGNPSGALRACAPYQPACTQGCPSGKCTRLEQALFAGGYPFDARALGYSTLGGALSYFIEVGDIAGAQSYLEGAKAGTPAYAYEYPWGFVACEAFDLHDQNTLQKVLVNAEADAAKLEDRLSYAWTLLAVGERDRARVVAHDLVGKFQMNSHEGFLLGRVLLALGEKDRVKDVTNSPQLVTASSPCDYSSDWWGTNRMHYLLRLAMRGVTLSNDLDETTLGDYLRESADIMGGRDDNAAGHRAFLISRDIRFLASEYRNVHGPYRR